MGSGGVRPGLVAGKTASTGIDLLPRLSSICLISAEPSVQSASRGTTWFFSIAALTLLVSIAVARLYLHVGHQSAEKSTSTVAPLSRNSASRARLKGCSHGITDFTGPSSKNAAVPIAVASDAACTQRPNPMSPPCDSCARPTHQQAIQMPIKSTNVGTNQSWWRNVNR